MATHREIRALIAARLEAIESVGVVHQYERWLKRREDLKALYVGTIGGNERLFGWFIRRVGGSSQRGHTLCAARFDAWEIRGFMALDDADESEMIFDDVIDAIISDFHETRPLGNGVRVMDENEQACRLVQSQPVMFAGVLCHSATLALNTKGAV